MAPVLRGKQVTDAMEVSGPRPVPGIRAAVTVAAHGAFVLSLPVRNATWALSALSISFDETMNFWLISWRPGDG